eukprot:TRINITY_DN2514_c0_g1_i1.p1 TRINITY_DN2514_c0_g1~~TRINITY_DN2514_c0_g1_i1.p1  ORF type:complete len:381 (-),score=68.39 TRINITY_DN2514_c0_g1_i1:25-1167(-)
MNKEKAKEALRTFKGLFDDGLISAAEFETKRRQVLDLLTQSMQQNPQPVSQPVASTPQKGKSATDQLEALLNDADIKVAITDNKPPPAPKGPELQCVATMSGHTNYVFALAISGVRLFSASGDGSIKVWDLRNLGCVATITEHEGTVYALTVNDKYLFSGGWDNTIRVFELSSLKQVHIMKGHSNYVSALLVHGQRLYSGSWDSSIQTWDLNTFTKTTTLLKADSGQSGNYTGGHNGPVTALIMVGDNLISASQDGAIKIWSTAFVCKRTLLEHTNWVYSLTVVGKHIFSASRDNSIKVWDLETGKCIKTIQDKEYQVSLAKSANRIFVGCMDKTIKVLDPTTYETVDVLKGHNGNVYTLLYANDTLYSGSWDKTIKIWQ